MSPNDPLDGERLPDAGAQEDAREGENHPGSDTAGGLAELRFTAGPLQARGPTPAPSPDQLPSYLGLGYLRPDSVRVDGDRLTAEYGWNDELVYRIDWMPGRCRVDELENGKVVMSGLGRHVEPAALGCGQGVRGRSPSPFMERLARRLVGRAYVHREVDSELVFASYPAIAIVTIRHVLRGEEAEKAIADPSSVEPHELDPYVNPGAIVSLWSDGQYSVERVAIVDSDHPAIDIPRVAARLWELGREGTTKEDRIVVFAFEVPSSASIRCYVGEPVPGLDAYAIVKQPDPAGFEEAIATAKETLKGWRSWTLPRA